MAAPAYGERGYRAMAADLAAATRAGLAPPCWRGCGRPATSPDHVPPLARHHHVAGSGCCTLAPSCLPCQRVQGARERNARRARGRTPAASRRW